MVTLVSKPFKCSTTALGIPCCLSAIAHQLLTIALSNGDQELIQAHAGIYGHLSTKVGLDLVVLDCVWRFIADQRGQTCKGWGKM